MSSNIEKLCKTEFRNKEENESITLLDLSIQGVQFIPVNIFQVIETNKISHFPENMLYMIKTILKVLFDKVVGLFKK